MKALFALTLALVILPGTGQGTAEGSGGARAQPTSPPRYARSPSPFRGGPTVADVIAQAPAADWQAFDQADLLYMMLADNSRVVIALAPDYAPHHVAAIKALVAARWFDGTAITRVQDNYVVQWGDPGGHKPLPPGAPAKLAPEWERAAAKLPPATPVPGPDGYAPAHAWVGAAWPVALDPSRGNAWLVHCYGMVGVGRDEAADSANATELYAVIGATPRGLDRNVTLVGRVIDGIERLSALPRGTGALGFYARAEARVPIRSIRIGTDLPVADRLQFEALRAGTPTFAALVAARATRRESFFVTPTGFVDLCNVRPPIRQSGR